jgi:hypothetical protein
MTRSALIGLTSSSALADSVKILMITVSGKILFIMSFLRRVDKRVVYLILGASKNIV